MYISCLKVNIRYSDLGGKLEGIVSSASIIVECKSFRRFLKVLDSLLKDPESGMYFTSRGSMNCVSLILRYEQ